jgi:hypothetical protein
MKNKEQRKKRIIEEERPNLLILFKKFMESKHHCYVSEIAYGCVFNLVPEWPDWANFRLPMYCEIVYFGQLENNRSTLNF